MLPSAMLILYSCFCKQYVKFGIFSAQVNMKKYKRALKNNGKLKSLYKEKFGAADMTEEKLDNFKEALQFVVKQNEDPGLVG